MQKSQYDQASTKQKQTPLLRPAHSKPPRSCATADCSTIPEGRAFYCAACRHARRLQRQKEYRNAVKSLQNDMPPEPPTSLNWLNKFKGWAGSGMSYAEYQVAGLQEKHGK